MLSKQFKRCSAIVRNTLRNFVNDTEHGHGSENLKGSKSVMTGERGINKVILVGRVGKTPEHRGTEANPVTIFPLATSYSLRTLNGQFVQKTEWHRICVFRQALQDIVTRNVEKGHKVYVSGSISYTSFMDDKNNIQKMTSILADDVLVMQRRAIRRDEEEEEEATSDSDVEHESVLTKAKEDKAK